MKRRLTLWFLLGLFLCLAVVMISLNGLLMFRVANRHLSESCKAARAAYERGGAASLKRFLAESPPGPRMRLLDANGRDLLTGEIHTAPLAHGGRGLLRIPSPSIAAGNYSCIVDMPDMRVPVPLGPFAWLLPFLATLCFGLAGYLAWRVRTIENALTRFGAGQLDIRMDLDANDSIGRLSHAFNEMAARIEALVAAERQLCGDLAHELRSPLARLRLSVPLARNGNSGALDQIENDSRRLEHLADGLLGIARAELDPAAIDLQTVDVEALLGDIADNCAVEARTRNCELDLRIAPGESAAADAELLRRAIENVIRNAIQHSPPLSRIEVAVQAAPQSLSVAVRDFGPGVPAGALDNIFRPFYRVRTGRESSNGGVGLGLSIAQRAVALHRGKISAENCFPGLRVTIEIPRRQPLSRR